MPSLIPEPREPQVKQSSSAHQPETTPVMDIRVEELNLQDWGLPRTTATTEEFIRNLALQVYFNTTDRVPNPSTDTEHWSSEVVEQMALKRYATIRLQGIGQSAALAAAIVNSRNLQNL